MSTSMQQANDPTNSDYKAINDTKTINEYKDHYGINERTYGKCICPGRRYYTSIFLSLGIFCAYLMRVNLSVSIEPMSCEYKWSSTKQGYILSSFYIGYTIGNTLGGILSSKYGGKIIFLLAILSTSILTLLIPFCTSYSFVYDFNLNCKCLHSISSDWCFSDGLYTNKKSLCNMSSICNNDSHIYLLIILRIFMGLFEAFSFPALFAIINQWTIKSERSKLMGIAISGGYFGTMIGFPLCTLMINSNNHYFGSWINTFYLFSIVGFIWCILFVFTVYNEPINDKFIGYNELMLLTSDEERNKNNNPNRNNVQIPWIHMLTNRVAITCYVAHFSYNWTNYTLLTELPTYLNNELNYNLSNSLFISILPFLGSFIMQFIGGYIVDLFINSNLLQRKNARKLSHFIASIIPGLLMVICGYLHNKYIIVSCIIFAATIMPLGTLAYMPNFVDISPTLSNVLFGISNTIGTIPGVIAPISDGYILDAVNNDSVGWTIVFWIVFIVSTAGTSVYAMFTDTDFIPELNIGWNDKPDDASYDKEDDNKLI